MQSCSRKGEAKCHLKQFSALRGDEEVWVTSRKHVVSVLGNTVKDMAIKVSEKEAYWGWGWGGVSK